MTTTERPRRLTAEMKMVVAIKTATQLAHDGLIPAGEIDSHASDIAKHGESYMDGYKLAKNLDSYCHWDCDMEMAEALDNFQFNAESEIEAAEKEWFKLTNPQPPLEIGTKVTLKRGETGVIDGIYEYGPAKYTIKVDGDPRAEAPTNSRRIVNFEDAEAISEIPDRSEPMQSQAAR